MEKTNYLRVGERKTVTREEIGRVLKGADLIGIELITSTSFSCS